ncbi:MAG: DNA polymerase IV [Candidatus Zixiibacteriota bacterium]|nr:MAG: DNA polymerase IV [candidate division Zixibacteria bacterium]
MRRTIFHIDINAFFASVEQTANPSLKGKPIATIGRAKRTVVTAPSYEARRSGVKTGMNVWEAKKACPSLILVVSKNSLYVDVSKKLVKLYESVTPLVEVFSIDEAFLDVTEVLGRYQPEADPPGAGNSPEALAREIKRQIRNQFDITCSVGIASNKLLAKLGSELQKPDGLVHLRPDQVPQVLENLPVDELCGIGRRLKQDLANLGIYTCGQLARYPVEILKKRYGVRGMWLHDMANGVDNSEVIPPWSLPADKSVGHSMTLPEDVNDRERICWYISQLSEQVARRMRRGHYQGKTVSLILRYSDFETFSKDHTIKKFIDSGYRIAQVAIHTLDTIKLKQAIRLVGVSVSNLIQGTYQLPLFERERKERVVTETMDRINDKWGELTLHPAVLLHRHPHKGVIAPAWRPYGVKHITYPNN